MKKEEEKIIQSIFIFPSKGSQLMIIKIRKNEDNRLIVESWADMTNYSHYLIRLDKDKQESFIKDFRYLDDLYYWHGNPDRKKPENETEQILYREIIEEITPLLERNNLKLVVID